MLARAIARCLEGHRGLNVVYLPAGINPELATSLLDEINKETPDVPRAILIGSPEIPKAISSSDALKYRQGNRIALVSGRHTDLGSFTQSFREVIGLNYPSDSGDIPIGKLAEVCTTLIYEDASLVPLTASLNEQRLADIIEGCFSRLRDIHQAAGSDSVGWNSIWFNHVLSGLENIRTHASLFHDSRVGVDKILWACFGLPHPVSRRSATGSVFADAFASYWNSGTSAQYSALQLAERLGGHTTTSLASDELEWSEYDQILVTTESIAQAFSQFIGSSSTAVLGLAEISDQNFLNPEQTLGSGKLVLRDANGVDLNVLDEGLTGSLNALKFYVDSDTNLITSEEFCIVIPCSRVVTEEDLAPGTLSTNLRPNHFSWEGEETPCDEGIMLQGRLISSKSIDKFKLTPRKIALSVSVDANAPIAPATNRESKGELFPIFPAAGGLWLHRVQSRRIVGRPEYIGPEEKGVELDNDFHLTLASEANKFHAVVWSDQSSPNASSFELAPVSGRTDIHFATFDAVDHFVIEADDSHYEVKVQSAKPALRSPLLASLLDTGISSGPLTEDELGSLRGKYESWIANMIVDPDYTLNLNDLGHWAVPSDQPANVDSLVFTRNSGVAVPRDFSKRWSSMGAEFSLPEDFIESDEVHDFMNAFHALSAGNVLLESNEKEEGTTTRKIPSMASWKVYLQTSAGAKLLDNYLDSYTALLRKAKEYRRYPFARFLAAYPFSVSVWDGDRLGCSTVLLSPLHPLRLAWLASVEDALSGATLTGREQLVGTIEGWNFPYLGPRPGRKGHMVAVPSEAGEDQLFLGWSMLISASMDGGSLLQSPSSAAGLSLPGSTASGINSSAVSSALRDFRKVNSHLSTITVDLASSSSSPRLASIDSAVIKTVSSWTQNSATPLTGGLRVLDSVNRAGSPSSESIELLKKCFFEVPAVWSRYHHNSADMPRCNVRVLQDGGVAVETEEEPVSEFEQQLGVLGPVPLRRFQLPYFESEFGIDKAVQIPGIHSSSEQGHWNSYTDALTEIEQTTSGKIPVVLTSLHSGLIGDTQADWTIAGESFMDPLAMSRLVSEGHRGKGKMLWEWRPPFLQSSGSAPGLEQRPFVSIAKIPHHFKQHISNLMSVANPKEANGELADQLLHALGSRGVGLSSMLAMGGTHASGAVGFYLTFELLTKYQSNNTQTFVMPIDACDTFLHALGDQRTADDITRRADLLLMHVTQSELTLLPIEIKAYGLGEADPSGNLPHLGDARLKEPLSQLENSVAVLEAVKQKEQLLSEDESTTGDRALWYNSLASLVESALRLSKVDASSIAVLHRSLEKIARGETRLNIGAPVISYFKHIPDETSANLYHTETADDLDSLDSSDAFPVGLFTATPSAVFEALGHTSDENPSGLLNAWTELIDWAKQSRASLEDEPQFSAGDVTLAPRQDSPSVSEDSIELVEPTQASEVSGAASVDTAPGQSQVTSAPAQGSEIVDSDSSDHSPNEEHAEDQDGQWCDGVRFTVGHRTTGNLEVDFWPSNTDLNQLNIGVVGDLGTGKTQLTKALIYQLRQARPPVQPIPPSMLIFDYKRDFQDEEFLQNVGGEVLDLYKVPLNFFDLGDSAYTKRLAVNKAREFTDVLSKIYSNVGPVQKQKLRAVIIELFESSGGNSPTLDEVLERYEDSNGLDSVTSIISSFVDSEIFDSDKSNLKPFAELLSNRVLVVPLSQLATDDQGKNAVVTLFLNMYFDHMLKSTKWPFTDGSPSLRRLNSYLVVDEAVNIMKYNFPVLMNLLLQGREFGVGVLLASQYLSHFKQGQVNYAEPLLTWFIHKVPQIGPKDLVSIGIRSDQAVDLAERVSSQGLHQSLYKSHGWPNAWIEDLPYYRLVQES